VSRIPPKTIVLWPIWLHTIPLLALPLLALLFAGNVQPWIFMWALAFALFAGCKWLTHVTALRRGLKPRWSRALAYLLTWPGMDAESFYRIENRPLKPGTAEWSLAVANILLGLVLVWFVTRRVLPFSELATGWTGMVGIVLVLHFGWFKILSLAWRAVGVGAKPLMQTPVLAKSLGEFWGRRWNTAFHDLANRFGFRPLRRSIGATFATLAVFALSGLVHELVISVPARGGFGLPTVYFLIQGLGVVGEHTNTGRRMGLGRGGRGWLFAIMLAALPAPLLFHPPFIHNVILPMLAGIGAT
jgi:alginate O-acetyltransferase complex protein AlgI